MEQALRAFLLSRTTLAALIGDRLTPLTLPQAGLFPAITYRVISGPRDYTQDGPDGVTRFRVQLDMYGLTYGSARNVRDAFVRECSGAYDVGAGSPPLSIQGIFIDSERDLYEPALDGTGPHLYRKSIDIFVTVSIQN